MLAALCCLLLALPAAAQVSPTDTTQRPADTTGPAIVRADTLPAPLDAQPRPLPDTTRQTPLAAPQRSPATQLLLTPPLNRTPQARPDTAARADTSLAGAPAPPDTAAAFPDAAPPPALRDGETGRLMDGVARQVAQLRRAFSLQRLLLALLALAVTYLLVLVVLWLMERLARWRPGYAYPIRRVQPLVKFGLWFAAAWLVVGSLFAGSTLVLVLLVVVLTGAGMAAGLPFVRDLAGGLVLTFEQPFQIGSRVAVGPHAGEVRKIGLRAFELATPDGAVVVIPNAEVLRRSLVATPPGVKEAPVTVTLPLPASVDPDAARSRVREAAWTSPYVYAARPLTVALLPAGPEDGRLRLRIDAFVFDAAHADALASDLVRHAHAVLAEPLPEA